MGSIATDIFRLNGAAISRTMLMLYGKRWIAAAACLLLPMILMGIFLDVRWVIVSLMAIFIVFPMLLAFLFFYYGMNRVSVVNSTRHALEFGEEGINALIYDKAEASPGSEDTQERQPAAKDEEMKPQYRLRSKTLIGYPCVTGYSVGVSNVVLHTTLGGKGFLIVPLSAFADKPTFMQAIEMVRPGISKNRSNN